MIWVGEADDGIDKRSEAGRQSVGDWRLSRTTKAAHLPDPSRETLNSLQQGGWEGSPNLKLLRLAGQVEMSAVGCCKYMGE